MEKIVIVGSANTDLIVRADRIPSPGETVLGGEFRIVSGWAATPFSWRVSGPTFSEMN